MQLVKSAVPATTDAVSSTPAMRPVATVPATAAASLLPQPSQVVSTTAGTLHITLEPVPVPVPKSPMYENPAVWVPVATLIGVVISMRSAWKKTKFELSAAADQANIERNQSRDQAKLDREHAADQAHQERIATVRREVYLELITEMTKAQFAITQFPTQDVEKLEVQAGFGGLIAVTAKISIVGEMPTVIKSRELLSAINESMLRMLLLLVPLNEQKRTEQQLQEEISFHRQRIAQIDQRIEGNELHHSRDTHILRTEADALYKRIDKCDEEILAAQLAFNAACQTYNHTYLNESRAINAKVDEVVGAMRDELGLTTSMFELRASSEEMHTAACAALGRMHKAFAEEQPAQ